MQFKLSVIRIVMSCKIFNSSMKLKFFLTITVIHKFLVLFHLLRGSDMARSPAGCKLWVVHP